jgi:hypothetical protein
MAFCWVVNARTLRRIKKSNERMNLLSRENARLLTENEVYKDKLKNMGFTDAHLKI